MTTEVEKVELFRVLPGWGNKNLRVVKTRALRKGKTTYVPISMLSKWGRKRLGDTAKDAVANRLNDELMDIKDGAKWRAKEADCVKALKKLLKEV